MSDAVLIVLAIVVVAAIAAAITGQKMKFTKEEIVLLVAAVLLPPLAVFLKVGFDMHFWLNLALTLLGCWIPGCIHAVWIVVKEKQA